MNNLIFLVSIGGICGLFFGISFIGLVDISYQIYKNRNTKRVMTVFACCRQSKQIQDNDYKLENVYLEYIK